MIVSVADTVEAICSGAAVQAVSPLKISRQKQNKTKSG
jgi:hypothetical protein